MMRNCPHCQFLLTTDSDTCAVCNLPVEQPPPVPSGLVAAMASTEAPAGGAAPGAAPSGPGTPPSWSVPGGTAPPTGPPAPGFAAPGFSAPGAVPPWAPQPTSPPPGPAGFQVAPAPTKSKGRVIAVVLALVALLFVALVGLTFVGTTTESADVVPDRWATYTDPSGRYSVELPGTAVTTNNSEEVPGVGTVATDVAEVTRPAWTSAVVLVDAPDGSSAQVSRPLLAMVEGMFDGLEAAGVLDDVTVTNPGDLASPLGPSLQGNLTASQDDTPLVGMVWAVQVGDDYYLLVALGPSDRKDDVDQAFSRMMQTFATPAQ